MLLCTHRMQQRTDTINERRDIMYKYQKELDSVFSVIKHNCSCFGGNKELYNDAMKAYYSVKFSNAEMSKRHGLIFAKKYAIGPDAVIDSTGTITHFAQMVSNAHNFMG